MTIVYVFLTFIIIQRLIELRIAAKNEQWMKKHGALEVGKEHYKYFIILHVCFFISLLIETNILSLFKQISFYFPMFFLFLMAQVGRISCMLSLGKFWNTKIIVIPNVIFIKKGLYKYVRHPNYIIVLIELFVIPLMFGAFITAFIFPLLHILLMFIRIPAEERALGKRA